MPTPTTPAVAWAESPLQLLSAVEAHRAGLLGPAVEVVLRPGSAALAATAAEIRRLGPPAGFDDGAVVARDAVWAIGDAFSGTVQRRLVTSGARPLVLLDDGLATLHLLELLAASRQAPLIRARARAGLPRRALGLAARARLRAAARARRLAVFTALPVAPALRSAVLRMGAELVAHDFPWLRGLPAGPPPPRPRIVLGGSLVRNGLIRRDRYLEWAAKLAAVEPVAYYPHRRECPEVLAELRRDPGVTVVEQRIPVELALRGLTPDHRVISLPSTALTSLRVVLRASGATIEGVPVPDDWWTGAAAPALRRHLSTPVGGLEPAT